MSERLESCTLLDIFSREELQSLQDRAAMAFNVASIITYPDGSPVTQPSQFTHFCSCLMRDNKDGFRRCMNSESGLGRLHEDGPIISKCHSGGLMDAGASIIVNGKHLGNWLLGQVLTVPLTKEDHLHYMDIAKELGLDIGEVMSSVDKVPVISKDRFESIAFFIYHVANAFSSKGFNNYKQKLELEFQTKREKAFNNAVKSMREDLRRDPMTKLLNKVAVKTAVSKHLQDRPKLTSALMILDIDNFKKANDTLGHLCGDRIICDLASVLQSVFRTSDIVGRVGGDEFLVYLENALPETVEKRALQVCSAFSKIYEHNGRTFLASTSIGIFISSDEFRTFDSLYAKADQALYEAKSSGKNSFKIYAELDDLVPTAG
ncbi:MAG: PocR ligand-binding domain-containing protein [Fibrobacteraceae bacterium]|nr:PocR ligand-binding domain-containing protein [Fibrobacteraceae bacterium]